MEATVKVKTERPDEAEIRELAAKMVEANKAKALAAGANRPGLAPGAAPGSILGYLSRNNKPATPEERPKSTVPTPDERSWRGHFGWDMLGKCHIPYLYRSGEKYVAVRMVEMKLLNKYLNYLHADIYSCTCIRSYYISEQEARLLNEINNRHCDGQFGREPFTCKDLIVRLSDAYEFYSFLDVCYNKLLRGSAAARDKCGFIRINKESVVPYTVRGTDKFVPLFYFEGETDNLKLKSDQLSGWDLSYLKFCCKVQGIRNELFASETCSVISLQDIRLYFPPGTEFEEYWPHKVVDSQLLITTKGSMPSSSGGQWTRAPHAPPPGTANAQASATAARGRRPTPARVPSAQQLQQMQHASLSAAAQVLANGWSLPASFTQAQTQQVLRMAQQQAHTQAAAAAAQAQAVARYGNAAMAAALPQHRAGQQRNMQQFSGGGMSMSMNQQPPPPPLVRNNSNSSANVPPQVSMNGHSIDSRKRLTAIPEVPISGNITPYKVQKALVENTMVPCINAKPYMYQELLMTLPDLASHYFPRVSLATCRAMIDALGITLYRPNNTQLNVLRSSGKCKSAAAGDNSVALVQIRDVMTHMPQFKYMLRSGLPDDHHALPPAAHTHHNTHNSHNAHSSHNAHNSHNNHNNHNNHAHPPPAKRTRAN